MFHLSKNILQSTINKQIQLTTIHKQKLIHKYTFIKPTFQKKIVQKQVCKTKPPTISKTAFFFSNWTDAHTGLINRALCDALLIDEEKRKAREKGNGEAKCFKRVEKQLARERRREQTRERASHLCTVRTSTLLKYMGVFLCGREAHTWRAS